MNEKNGRPYAVVTREVNGMKWVDHYFHEIKLVGNIDSRLATSVSALFDSLPGIVDLKHTVIETGAFTFLQGMKLKNPHKKGTDVVLPEPKTDEAKISSFLDTWHPLACNVAPAQPAAPAAPATRAPAWLK